MEKVENGEKTDILKLFIVLMVLSAVGFGVGAAYLYHHQSTWFALYETEKKAMDYIIKVAESPANKPYLGFERKGAGRTAGADLADYLLKKARTHGVPFEDYRTDTDERKSKGYSETKVNLKLADVTMEQIIRYLFNVQQGKNDIYINTLKLSSFDYEQPIPTCNATIDIVVFEKLSPGRKK